MMKVYITEKRGFIQTITPIRDKITDIEVEIDDDLYENILKVYDYQEYRYQDGEIISRRIEVKDEDGFRTLDPEPFSLQKQYEDNLVIIPIYKYHAVVIQYPLKYIDELSDKSVILKIDGKEYPLIFDEFKQGVYTLSNKELRRGSLFEIENKINYVYFCPNHPCDINFIDLKDKEEDESNYIEVPVIDGVLQIPLELQETIGYLLNEDDEDDILDYFIIEETLELPKGGILVINGMKIKPVIENA